MANVTQDKTVVRVAASLGEFTNMLSDAANAAGLISFVPDRVEVHDNGDGWEIVFEKDNV